MRDHRKLRAFELADGLVLSIYSITKSFPREEQFGLTSQLRRAALSIASNIVEGCARSSQADYLRFPDMALGSAREVEYHLSVAARLECIPAVAAHKLSEQADETAKVLAGLLRSLRASQRPTEELNPVLQIRSLPCDPVHLQGVSNQYPDLESNQDLDLRRVRCDPLHHRDVRSY